MSVKYKLASLTSKAIGKVCRAAKYGGTTLPGKIACRIYPDALREAARHYKVIMVIGTNGKTTTTLMVGRILKENGINYITNKSGANLIGGIATTFFNTTISSRKPSAQVALIEVDEAAFNIVCNFIEPDILIVTNFFRDQLDRYGELYTTLGNIRLGIQKLKKTRLILNADDSLCASLGRGSHKKVVYYGMGPDAYQNAERPVYTDAIYCIYCKSKYTYSNYIYGHLGGFKCPNCGFSRPYSSITCLNVDELGSSHSQIQLSVDSLGSNKPVKKEIYKVRINLPGLYNVYNSLAALSCGALLNLPIKNSLKSLDNFECGFGRMEVIKVDGREIRVILVKNPSSFNQAIDSLSMGEKHIEVAFLINDRLADGTDISWLWDVAFEKLNRISEKINGILVSGVRAEDMALRLKYAGIDTWNIRIIKDYREMIHEGLARILKGSGFYIFATYTAMFDIRKQLKEMFGLKEFWQ